MSKIFYSQLNIVPCALETAVPTIQSSRHRGRAGPHIAHSGRVTSSDPVSHPGCSCEHKTPSESLNSHNSNLKLACGCINRRQKRGEMSKAWMERLWCRRTRQLSSVVTCRAAVGQRSRSCILLARCLLSWETWSQRMTWAMTASSEITLFAQSWRKNTKTTVAAFGTFVHQILAVAVVIQGVGINNNSSWFRKRHLGCNGGFTC